MNSFQNSYLVRTAAPYPWIVGSASVDVNAVVQDVLNFMRSSAIVRNIKQARERDNDVGVVSFSEFSALSDSFA